MGSSLFQNLGVDIAGLVNTHLGESLIDATLKKSTRGTYSSSNPLAGSSPTLASYACKAMNSEFMEAVLEGDLVRVKKGEVVVILRSVASLKVPQPGDKLAITTPTGASVEFTIVGDVEIDPAGATATFEVEA